MVKNKINFSDFEKIDMRIGTIIKISVNEKANKPAYILEIDFGNDIGIKKSSAQITNYKLDELINQKIAAVCNFEKKNIAGVESEVLVLGALNHLGNVILLKVNNDANNGDIIA